MVYGMWVASWFKDRMFCSEVIRMLDLDIIDICELWLVENEVYRGFGLVKGML